MEKPNKKRFSSPAESIKAVRWVGEGLRWERFVNLWKGCILSLDWKQVESTVISETILNNLPSVQKFAHTPLNFHW